MTSDKCQAHIKSGAKKVVISAPAKVGIRPLMYIYGHGHGHVCVCMRIKLDVHSSLLARVCMFMTRVA